jgi:peptide/nickel transport system ATP-binding protein
VQLNMAVILITHDLGIVAQWADRVVVMYAGRKIEEGFPGEVFETPYHPYTNGLLSASPRLKADYHYRDGPLSEIPGSIVSAAGEKGCSFRPRCPVARPACALTVPQLIALPAGRQVACPYVPAIAEKAHVASVG